MISFETLRETLQRHLPRALDGSLVTATPERLEVHDPGVSIGDLALMLQELSGADDMLPEGLPLAGIRLASLTLARGAGGVELAFSVRWAGATLAIASDLALHFDRLDFELRRRVLRARAQARLDIEGHSFDVAFELPSQIFELVLEPAQLAGAMPLLASRGLVATSGLPVLRAFVLRGSLRFERVLLHVELDNLFTFGPVTLTKASATLLLAGDGSEAAASARLDIALHGGGVLQIDVDGEVDALGWRVAGELQALPATLTLGALVDAFTATLTAGKPPPAVPDAINNCSLEHLGIALDSHDGSLGIDARLEWPHGAELVVRLDHQGGVLRLSGRLTMADAVFELAFTSAGKTLLMGTYEAAGSKPMTLDAILAALSGASPSGPALPSPNVLLAVKSAAIVLDANKELLVAAQVDAGIDLSRLGELPLVGALLPHAEPLGLRIDPYYMSSAFDAKQLALLPSLPASIALPAAPTAGVHIAATLQLGATVVDMSGNTPDLDHAAPPSAAPAGAAAPAAAAGAMTWKDVHKTLGPLHIDRAGYATTSATPGGRVLELALDASLELAGITVSVNGLGASYEFDTRTLTPHLRGLGIDLQRGDLRAAGAFLHADGDFSGQVLLSTPKFSLNAIGAFTMIDGTPSMFAYAVLDMPLGGPAFFFVEGLAAGFGLHRRLHMPTIEALRSFPLVAGAGVKPAAGKKIVPADEQRKLHEYITPSLGEYFLAVGIKFNSFQLLHGFAVLVVSAGENFEIDLIGTADFVSPPDLPDTVPALARIRLDLMARFAPDQGLIAVEARLDPASYVYGPLCHLSGGFAFYAWTKGEDLRGDFVLSVGGYNTAYTKPAHYPVVPRVELSYQVTPEVYLKGNGYFALTPSVMMAGGGLHAQLADGSLHAWADFTVDFWVAWEPFHYDMRMQIGIGASWKCFSTSASADLHIWGPDFSGTAHVDWWAFSFDFHFGPLTPVVPLPISLEKFKQSFLLGRDEKGVPNSPNKTLGIVVTAGVVAQLEGDVLVVEPAGLVIATSSQVPATTARLGTSITLGAPALGVAPSAKPSLDLSEHTITITRAGSVAAVDAQFVATKLETGFPAALWSPTSPVDKQAKPIMATSGLELRPRTPVIPGAGRNRLVGSLAYDPLLTKTAQRTLVSTKRTVPLVEPSALPVADLATLGLGTSALAWVAHRGRARLDMLTGDLEAAHG